MLKFGIRQAGGCGRRPKNANPLPNPTSRPKKKAQGPRNPPEAPRRRPEAPRRRRRLPGGPREAPAGLRGAAKPRRPQPFQEVPGNLGPARQGLWTEAKKPETHYQTQRADPKKRLKSRASEAPPAPQTPPKARRPRRPPDGFGAPKATTGKAHNLSGRSRKGIEALETRPWIKARQIRGGVGI